MTLQFGRMKSPRLLYSCTLFKTEFTVDSQTSLASIASLVHSTGAMAVVCLTILTATFLTAATYKPTSAV